jgi:hypothetical protein
MPYDDEVILHQCAHGVGVLEHGLEIGQRRFGRQFGGERRPGVEGRHDQPQQRQDKEGRDRRDE